MFRVLGIALVVATLGLVPANTLGSASENESSAHTTLVAAEATLSGVIGSWRSLEAGLHKLVAHFGSECPDVGQGSPQNEPEQKLAYEVAGALWAVGYHTDARFSQQFIKAVSPLRWSNPKLARIARTFIKGLREMTALKVPDICADVRAWAASGYATVPASTLQFDRHVEAIDVEVPSPKVVEPYIQPSDRPLLIKVEHLLHRFEELEFTAGQRYWDALLETLDLQQ